MEGCHISNEIKCKPFGNIGILPESKFDPKNKDWRPTGNAAGSVPDRLLPARSKYVKKYLGWFQSANCGPTVTRFLCDSVLDGF